MKKRLFPKLSLLFVFVLFLQNGFAQDYTRWGLPNGAKARLSKGTQHDIVYSPDGTQIAIGSSIGIWLYDAHTGVELALLTGHTGIVLSVAYSPDGRTLAGGGGWRDGTIRLWDAATGRHKHILEGHIEGVTSMAFSPDGNTLASGNYKEIWLWDVTTGEHKQTLKGHAAGVESLAFSPDGGTLASGSNDNTIRLWDIATGKHKHTLEGHTDWVLSVAFSPDGLTLFSGGGWWDNTIRLWDAVTGEHKQTLEGHAGPVNSLVYSSTDGTLASGSQDGTALLWEVTPILRRNRYQSGRSYQHPRSGVSCLTVWAVRTEQYRCQPRWDRQYPRFGVGREPVRGRILMNQ